MSSEGCRRRLATNVIWKAVPGSRTCIREGPLAKLPESLMLRDSSHLWYPPFYTSPVASSALQH